MDNNHRQPSNGHGGGGSHHGPGPDDGPSSGGPVPMPSHLLWKLADYNDKYAIVRVGKNLAILEWLESPVMLAGLQGGGSCVPQKEPTLWAKSAWCDFLSWDTVDDGDGRVVPFHKIWLGSHLAKRFLFLLFDPPPHTPLPGHLEGQCVNMWRGHSMATSPPQQIQHSTCARLLDHHLHVLAGGNETVHNFLLDWWGSVLQRPGTKLSLAICYGGSQGCGKGIWCTLVGSMLGVHCKHLTSSRQLLNHFNNHLVNASLILLDEAHVPSNSRELAGILKGLLTEHVLHIESKGIDSFPVANHLNLAALTNWTEESSLPIEPVWAPPQHPPPCMWRGRSVGT